MPTQSLIASLVLSATFFAGGTGLALAGQAVDFVRDVQPIFAKHCFKCHGEEEQNGGLRLDELDTLFMEADSGELPVVAGKPLQSMLLVRVMSTNEHDQMPPEGDWLSQEQIEVLRSWITDGAATPLPTDHVANGNEDSHDHWAFQPIRDPKLPVVKDVQWPRTSIDMFVASQRESAGLRVNEDASPTVLIRRLSYGLTGLPPTPTEVDHFVKSVNNLGIDAALESLVDKLLSRPSYGERWGRHWMDWVRYADTAGDNSDFPIPEAYLYRNYIIDSFNHDLPYDQFLIEQLAGDLLSADDENERQRQTIATGYLAMARRFGSLVETYPWHLTIEDIIDNVGRTMMGLTIACARCHDHKFDPISTREYYGLYGIFASTRYPFPGIELFQTQKDFVPLVNRATLASLWGDDQTKTKQLEEELSRLLESCKQQALQDEEDRKHLSIDEQRQREEALDKMLMKARNAGTNLYNHMKNLPPVPAAYAVQDDTPLDAAIQIKGEPNRPGSKVKRGFPRVLGGQRLPDDIAESSSGRLQLAAWITDVKNPLTARVIVNRVWQRHFGTGLVASTSDFGARGETPSNSDLLDHLATKFIRDGWSLKKLHRQILLSRTYRLSSESTAESLGIDPGNRLHWRFNRHRIDAESIRDTLLFVAGTLDTSPPNQPHPFPEKSKWEFTQHHPFKDSYDSNKRSVYLMTKRLTAETYFQTFDGPDRNVCTSDRDQSITALQALYFVNDAFLHEQADHYAARLAAVNAADDAKISQAFRELFCRDPTREETEWLIAHLATARSSVGTDDVQAWASVVRSLFRLNEFLYLD